MKRELRFLKNCSSSSTEVSESFFAQGSPDSAQVTAVYRSLQFHLLLERELAVKELEGNIKNNQTNKIGNYIN